MSRELNHAHDNCTGAWRLKSTGGNLVLKCDKCRVSYPATPENRQAAVDENFAGLRLSALTEEGVRLLRGES